MRQINKRGNEGKRPPGGRKGGQTDAEGEDGDMWMKTMRQGRRDDNLSFNGGIYWNIKLCMNSVQFYISSLYKA